LVYGVLGIALELDRTSLASTDVDPAAGRAFGAAAGVPGGHAGDLILGLHQVWDQLLHPVSRTAGESECPTTGDAEYAKETSAIYSGLGFVVHSDSIRSV
jgi:hypothetical protein